MRAGIYLGKRNVLKKTANFINAMYMWRCEENVKLSRTKNHANRRTWLRRPLALIRAGQKHLSEALPYPSSYQNVDRGRNFEKSVQIP